MRRSASGSVCTLSSPSPHYLPLGFLSCPAVCAFASRLVFVASALVSLSSSDPLIPPLQVSFTALWGFSSLSLLRVSLLRARVETGDSVTVFGAASESVLTVAAAHARKREEGEELEASARPEVWRHGEAFPPPASACRLPACGTPKQAIDTASTDDSRDVAEGGNKGDAEADEGEADEGGGDGSEEGDAREGRESLGAISCCRQRARRDGRRGRSKSEMVWHPRGTRRS
ncbi:UNVERIFIED_CONTAM: hypothetical protein HHA_450310 [Hammondia hammondi]|eukprot:XP_008889267.1 hypothetical protein HHA_450310 [Hammondia hammondi]